MKEKTKNPQAFPKSDTHQQVGMTLRDYFAAKAMAALMIDVPRLIRIAEENKQYESMHAVCADLAYGFADAMLKQRQEGE